LKMSNSVEYAFPMYFGNLTVAATVHE